MQSEGLLGFVRVSKSKFWGFFWPKSAPGRSGKGPRLGPRSICIDFQPGRPILRLCTWGWTTTTFGPECDPGVVGTLVYPGRRYTGYTLGFRPVPARLRDRRLYYRGSGIVHSVAIFAHAILAQAIVTSPSRSAGFVAQRRLHQK